MYAFKGRTVDNVIAAIGANHPNLTTQKSFYVEISRARDRADLVTDDAAELRAQLQAVTGERIAALEGIGEMQREAPAKAAETAPTRELRPNRGVGEGGRKSPEGGDGAREGARTAGARPRQGRHGSWIVTATACRPGPGGLVWPSCEEGSRA